MKGSCKSLVELDYFFEEVYKATTDQLDWNNPEGQQYPHDLRKPLPLIPNSCGRQVIPFDQFINKDLAYLSVPVSYDKHALWGILHWGRKRQQLYGFAANRESSRDVYSKRRIIVVTKLQIVEWHNYKHLDWIIVHRDDDKLYKFKEGKLTNLTVEERLAFNVSLRMFTRSILIQRRVEDLQLGVESYQKKLNLTKPDTYRSDVKRREAYTTYSNPRGFIYQNKDKKSRLMSIDELHKFSDGTCVFGRISTLNDVRTALNDRLKGIRMKYLPQTIWRQSDRDKAGAMIQEIDKQLKTRRIMQSLEKFVDPECLVLSPNFKLPGENQILLKIPRQDNMYSFDMKNIVPKDGLTCLVAKATSEESMLWHRRLGHVNFKNINKLVKENLVRDLPLKRFENDQTCVACLKGKQHRASCKTKAFSPITKPLFMLHMDLFGPTFVSSLMHKKYCLVVTDDYSRFSWVFFLRTKDETSEILKNFIKEVENLVDKKVKIIRSDNGTEFKNKVMDEFCREKGIKREYSVARTPQQNGVAERKNRTLIEAARTMLADSKLPTTFWAEAVSTACYVQNRVLIVKPHNKTPYELFRGIKPAIGFMKPFGCHVTILNTLDKLGKFDGKSDEGFFVGYSLSSKAFRVYNIRTRKVQENLHIGFLENKPMIEGNGPKWLFDLDSLTQSMNYVPVVAGTFSNDFAGIQGVSESSTSSQQDQDNQDCIVMPIWKDASYFDDASPRSVVDAQVQDQNGLHNEIDVLEKIHDDSNLQNNGTAGQQVNTARPEVNTGSREVSTAVPEVNTATPEDLVGPSPTSEDTQVEDQEIELGNIPPSYEVPTTPHIRIHKDHPIEHVIGDVQSSVQTRRMKTSYSEKGFRLTRTFILVFLLVSYLRKNQKEFLKLLVIGLLVQSGSSVQEDERGIVVGRKQGLLALSKDIHKKRVLTYDEVFAPVASFEDPDHPDKSLMLLWKQYMIIKHQSLMTSFLDLPRWSFVMVQQKKNGIFISQDKYVHEILRKFNYSDVEVCSTPNCLEKPLVKDGDADDVDEYLYRSMIGSLMYLTASKPDIMFAVYACARFQVSPKTSHLLDVKRIFRYLKGKPTLGLWYSKDSPLELIAYTDSDYAGATLDRKSTTGGSTGSKTIAEIMESSFMANLEFCDKHNMIAFLDKSTGSAGFHQIVDFLTQSHICYALTKKPEVCVSFIKQFWRSVEASTDDNGEGKINATIDGQQLSIARRFFTRLKSQSWLIKLCAVIGTMKIVGDPLGFGVDAGGGLSVDMGVAEALVEWTKVGGGLGYQRSCASLCGNSDDVRNVTNTRRPISWGGESYRNGIACWFGWSFIRKGMVGVGVVDAESKPKGHARVVLSDDEVFEDDSSKRGGSYLVQRRAVRKQVMEVKYVVQQKSTTAEEVPIVSTAEVDISTAGGTVTYVRKSAEKVSRQDKGKAIMFEEEPKKKSKKELEQERLSYAEAIRLEEQMNEEQRAQIASVEKIFLGSGMKKNGKEMWMKAKTTKTID
ncbi:putative ribonuclease H-like domain-containing protein [Tanacetum coccineum]